MQFIVVRYDDNPAHKGRDDNVKVRALVDYKSSPADLTSIAGGARQNTTLTKFWFLIKKFVVESGNGLVPDLVHSSFNDSLSQNCIYYVIV